MVGAAYDTFSQTNHSLQGLAVLFRAVPIPCTDVPCQDTLDGAGVEIPQYLRGYPEFPQASEVKQSLPYLPHCRVSMQRPGQALCDVDTKVLEAVHPLHRGPVDDKGGVVPPLLLPKVHNQLLSLADVQGEVVVLTPAGQVLYLLQVNLFIVICDQVHHSCVVRKLGDGVLS